MAYKYRGRLDDHNSVRFAEINAVDIAYQRGETTLFFSASPVLNKAVEVVDNPFILRVERQKFIFTTSLLEELVLPQLGDTILWLESGEQFRVVSDDESRPPYSFITSNRLRVMIETERVFS